MTLISAFVAGLMVFSLSVAPMTNIKAKTDDGKDVILKPDGTWEYDKTPKEEKTNAYRRPTSSKRLIKDKNGSYGIWINSKKWMEKKKVDNPSSSFEFVHTSGLASVMFISDNSAHVSADALKHLALVNAKNAAKDANIVFEEQRTVNGVEVLCLQIEGTVDSTPLVFYNYHYAGPGGVIQIVSYTEKKYFDKYKQDMTDLLNGFVVFK